LTDFLITAAREAALSAIKDNDMISLSLRDQRVIANSLLTSQIINPSLQKAINTHHDLIKAD